MISTAVKRTPLRCTHIAVTSAACVGATHSWQKRSWAAFAAPRCGGRLHEAARSSTTRRNLRPSEADTGHRGGAALLVLSSALAAGCACGAAAGCGAAATVLLDRWRRGRGVAVTPAAPAVAAVVAAATGTGTGTGTWV